MTQNSGGNLNSEECKPPVCDLCNQVDDNDILVSVTPKILSLPEMGSNDTKMMVANRNPFTIFFKMNSTNLNVFRPYPRTGEIPSYGIVIVTVRFYNSSIPIREHEEINIFVSTHPFVKLKDSFCRYCHQNHSSRQLKHQDSNFENYKNEKMRTDTSLKHLHKNFEIIIICKNCNQFVEAKNVKIQNIYDFERCQKFSGILHNHICDFNNSIAKKLRKSTETPLHDKERVNDISKENIITHSTNSKIPESTSEGGYENGSGVQNFEQGKKVEDQSDPLPGIFKIEKTFKEIQLVEDKKQDELCVSEDVQESNGAPYRTSEKNKIFQDSHEVNIVKNESDSSHTSVKKTKKSNAKRKFGDCKISEDISSHMKLDSDKQMTHSNFKSYPNSNVEETDMSRQVVEGKNYVTDTNTENFTDENACSIGKTYEMPEDVNQKFKCRKGQESMLKSNRSLSPHIYARILPPYFSLQAIDKTDQDTAKENALSKTRIQYIVEGNMEPSGHITDREFGTAAEDDVTVSKYARRHDCCEKMMMVLENRSSKILYVTVISFFLITALFLFVAINALSCVEMEKCFSHAKTVPLISNFDIVYNTIFQ